MTCRSAVRSLLCALFGSLAALHAAPQSLQAPSSYAGGATLNAQQAAEALDSFRQAGPARPCFLDFDLVHRPRRGAEQTYHGRLWAGRNAQGAVYRIEIEGGPRLLLQNGDHARVWRWTPAAGAAEVPALDPVMPGLELSAFDLQRPYLYWPLGGPVTVARVLGRPADVFVFTAPLSGYGDVGQVKAYLDSEYHAPVKVETLDHGGKALRTMALIDLHKMANGQWLPEDLDYRDEATRNYTRFALRGAAMDLDLSPAVFEPGGLDEVVAPPGNVERW